MTELAVPDSIEVAKNLPSAWLYQLEQAGSLATEILDERVQVWAHEGWTQQQMADEIGCSQSAVDRRCARLGVRTQSPRGRPKNNPHRVIQTEDVPEIIEVQPDGTVEEVIHHTPTPHCTHCEVHCPSARYRKEQ